MVQNMEIVKSKKKINISTKETRRKKRIVALHILLIVLLIISGINMNSAASYMKPGNIPKHCIFMGIFLMIYLSIIILHRKLNYLILAKQKLNRRLLGFGSFIFLLGVAVASGTSYVPKINGAYGWIVLGGLSIQPAEILKPIFVINMACILDMGAKNPTKKGLRKMFFSAVACLGMYGIPILFQKDLGTVIHYVLIWCFMIFLSKIERKYMIMVAGIVGMLGFIYISWKYFNIDETSSYKMMRIKSFIDGLIWDNYSEKYGYQVKQSIYAFGHGGIIGQGYFKGVQKYTYLPEIHTDFICATLAEEWGIIGMSILMLIYFMIYKIIDGTARDADTMFGKYLALGLGGQFIIQVFINIFVEVGLLPVFGLPMPLLSYGGSMMVSMGILFGIIGNMNCKRLKKK